MLGAAKINFISKFTTTSVAEVIRKKKGITAVGNAQIDTAQSKFGGSSALFDGASDYLLVGLDSSMALGSGDWSIEMWVRLNTTGLGLIYDSRPYSTNGFYPTIYTDSGRLKFFTNSADRIQSNVLSTGTWYHLAVVKSSGSTKMYIDGTQQGSTYTDSNTYINSGAGENRPMIGAAGDTAGGAGFNGWLDEIRVSNTARYTTSFTPSTTPFVNDANTLLLLHMNGTDASTFFEDDNGVRAQTSCIALGNAQISTAQSKFGGTSLLLDGTDDYVQVYSDGFAFGTGDFTIECWARVTSAKNQGVFHLGNSYLPSSAGVAAAIRTDVGNLGWVLYSNGASTGTSPSPSLNTWYHIAVVRSSGTTTYYVNGTSVVSRADTTNYSASTYLAVGGYYSTGFLMVGNIDELRVSNTARYTTSFTPATEPFVNDTNTKLLMHMDGTNASPVFRDDNGLVPSTYTSDVVAFDGTGDYYSATGLSSTATADSKYALIALNFYWNGGDNLQHPINLRLGTGSGDYGFWIWINGGRSQLKFVTGTGSVPGSIYENTENSINTNAWNQIVMWVDTTSSTTSQIWVNGNSKAYSNDGFPTGALFNWTNTATTLKIGQKNTSQTSDGADFNGRISQVYVSAASSFPGIGYFWDHSTGRPKDLGTSGTSTGLASPLIYHYGDASTFPTNRGSFASYTLTANGNVATNAANTIYAKARRQISLISNSSAQISTAQSKFGGSSALFARSAPNDWIKTSDSPIFSIENYTSWTIEFWLRFANSQSDNFPISTSDDKFNMRIQSSGSCNFNTQGSSPSWTKTHTVGTWYHYAIVKTSDGTVTVYLDGVSQSTGNIGGSTPSSRSFYIGDRFDTGYCMDGYMDEIRFSKTARYTTTFTPSTTPFQNDADTILLLHCDGTNGSTAFFDDNGIAPYTP